MDDRTEIWIAALALSASGLILLATVFGRAGRADAAEAVMVAAAASGLSSFVLAGSATLRAVRSRSRAVRPPENE